MSTGLRHSTLDDPGDLQAEPGSRAWAVAVIGAIRLALKKLDSDAKHAREMLLLLEQHKGWKALGYAAESLLLTRELGIDDETAERIREAQSGQTVRVVLGKVGRPKKGEEKGCNTTISERGTVAYTLARLRRDRPELAEKVEAGEMTANAAAIEAGFRKKPTPLDELKRAWKKASTKEKNQFRKFIT